jgi:chloramphenicol 3-O phosphotransferase
MSSPQAAGKVIVLNGTSSAGKTTLALALQREHPDLQLVHIQLDAFRAMEPPGYWSNNYKELAPVRVEALCRAINSAAAQFARFGQNVVLDHVLTPKATQFLLEDLATYEVLLVKVMCSAEAMDLREAQRSNRPPGLARSQLDSVHAACAYDFEVDTTSSSPVDLARRLATWLRSGPLPTAFQHMQHLHAA